MRLRNWLACMAIALATVAFGSRMALAQQVRVHASQSVKRDAALEAEEGAREICVTYGVREVAADQPSPSTGASNADDSLRCASTFTLEGEDSRDVVLNVEGVGEHQFEVAPISYSGAKGLICRAEEGGSEDTYQIGVQILSDGEAIPVIKVVGGQAKCSQMVWEVETMSADEEEQKSEEEDEQEPAAQDEPVKQAGSEESKQSTSLLPKTSDPFGDPPYLVLAAAIACFVIAALIKRRRCR